MEDTNISLSNQQLLAKWEQKENWGRSVVKALHQEVRLLVCRAMISISCLGHIFLRLIASLRVIGKCL